MCIYIYTCMLVYIGVYMYIHIYRYIHIFFDSCTSVYKYIYTHIYVFTRQDAANFFLAISLLGMLCLEPILWCWTKRELLFCLTGNRQQELVFYSTCLSTPPPGRYVLSTVGRYSTRYVKYTQ